MVDPRYHLIALSSLAAPRALFTCRLRACFSPLVASCPSSRPRPWACPRPSASLRPWACLRPCPWPRRACAACFAFSDFEAGADQPGLGGRHGQGRDAAVEAELPAVERGLRRCPWPWPPRRASCRPPRPPGCSPPCLRPRLLARARRRRQRDAVEVVDQLGGDVQVAPGHAQPRLLRRAVDDLRTRNRRRSARFALSFCAFMASQCQCKCAV